jgi:AraC-like DNA-binding protein
MDQLVRRPNGLLLRRVQPGRERNWRDDACYKLLYAPDGAIRYRTNTHSFSLRSEQFVVLNPHERHQQLGFEREKWLVELSPVMVREVAEAVGLRLAYDIQFVLQGQKHPQLTRWMQFTGEYLRAADGEEAGCFFDHALPQLVLVLLKCAAGSHAGELPTAHLRDVHPALYRALEAMKDDYARPWTLAEMAETAGLNKYQFAHLFKETTGIAPYSWLQLYRLVRSQELLQHTERTVLEIALACGFSSLNVYHQLFKRIYGVSPGTFRKRYR